MRYEEAAALLEKYWAAETTLEEERALGEYFRQTVIDERLAAYRDVFVYFEKESERVPGEGLEARILKALKREERKPLVRKMVYYSAVAAVLAGLAFLVVYRTPLRAPKADLVAHAPFGGAANPSGATPADGGAAHEAGALPADSQAGGVITPSGAGRYAVKDTYQDPREALAAVQKALLRVSRKMNRGKDIAQRPLDKLNDSWTKAMTD